MQKIVLIVIGLLIIIGIVTLFVMYTSHSNEEEIVNQVEEQDITSRDNETLSNDNVLNNNIDNTLESSQSIECNQNMRIKLTINGREVYVILDDNKASRSFLEMLPLTLTFEDYNNTEKIATLPRDLSTEDLPSGYTPKVGDFSYYAPWGNISVFYKDFSYSNSLYKLGTIESGIEILENINEDFNVVIERVN